MERPKKGACRLMRSLMPRVRLLGVIRIWNWLHIKMAAAVTTPDLKGVDRCLSFVTEESGYPVSGQRLVGHGRLGDPPPFITINQILKRLTWFRVYTNCAGAVEKDSNLDFWLPPLAFKTVGDYLSRILPPGWQVTMHELGLIPRRRSLSHAAGCEGTT